VSEADRANETKIRILIAEDNVLTRLGAVAMIDTQPDMEVVAQARDGAEALRLFDESRPDVVVADLRMPHFDGVHLTAMLRQKVPEVRVLLLSHYDGGENVGRALEAGALGYLDKDAHGAELVQAIRTVYRGRRYLPPSLAASVVERDSAPALSARERQVLHEIARGRSNQEIAQALRVAPATVNVHVHNVLKKLGAKNRTEAVRVAVKRGLLAPE
jgi:two-component system NarL family response regulator